MKKVMFVLLAIAILATNSFAATKEWTVMVFLNADNNLERFGIADLKECEKIGSDENVNILVQLDRAEGYDTSNGNWTGTKRYYVTKNNLSTIGSQVVMDCGEVDMGSWEEAVDFFKWGADNYPANRYLYVYWNHGAGWVKEGEIQAVKGISYDDQSGNHIDSIGMKKAADGMAAHIGRKVDIVAFDACLMGMVEIQAQMEETVDILVASEETEPGDGWDYVGAMGAIVDNPTASTAVISRKLVEAYMASYEGQSNWWGPSTCTQASSYVAKVGRIQEAIDAFAAAIIKSNDFVAFGKAMTGAQSYAYSFYKDLIHFAQIVKDNSSSNSVKVAANGVIDAVNSSVILSMWQADKVKNSNGLAIYAPKSHEYKSHYIYTEFAKNTAWDELLQAYYGNRDAVAIVQNFENSINTENEEAYAKNIIRSIELGDKELNELVNERASERPEVYSDLMAIVNQVNLLK
ncbi:MAG: clostripain-related cysteine peptidase [Candidatus Muirbacterium halophilum]|nr:clostripain-related cysteine peptidase [Candidatus Muirbacterium halophilum]MCK9474903.1 clostripain-related cysteine peptidase [Candidatus Muirbacterium halophilum]